MLRGIVGILSGAFSAWFWLMMILFVLYIISNVLAFIGSNIIPILVIGGIIYLVYKNKNNAS